MKLLDDCVAALRAINEETVLAGYPCGDRDQTLRNVRAMRADLKHLRDPNPSGFLPTYEFPPEATIRVTVHNLSSDKALDTLTLTDPDTGDTLEIPRANVRTTP